MTRVQQTPQPQALIMAKMSHLAFPMCPRIPGLPQDWDCSISLLINLNCIKACHCPLLVYSALASVHPRSSWMILEILGVWITLAESCQCFVFLQDHQELYLFSRHPKKLCKSLVFPALSHCSHCSTSALCGVPHFPPARARGPPSEQSLVRHVIVVPSTGNICILHLPSVQAGGCICLRARPAFYDALVLAQAE